jgi:hypothetical protein
MMPRRPNPKSIYRLQQLQRANESATLAEKFPKLKSLTVDLAYFEPDGVRKNGEMRYRVNVSNARSVFSFACPSGDCVGGDFDLSVPVAEAVARRRKMVEGQIECQGSRRKPKEQAVVPCHNLLRYKLSLVYV